MERNINSVVENNSQTPIKGSDLISVLSRKSYSKFDGVKIWDYLHNKGIRIELHISSNKIGMTHVVCLDCKEIATISTSSQKGKSIITTDLYFDISCDEKDLDIVFLVAFSIAKTEQITYN